MKNVFKNKWFILGIVAVLIVAAVILAIVLGGGKDDGPDPAGTTQSTENNNDTQPSGDGTEPSGDATEPSGDATEPSDKPEDTKPEENFTQTPVTDPTELPPESEYTGPSGSDPTDPDEPVEEPIDPTKEPDLNPDDPDDPVKPPVVERPEKYDFTGITPGNITAAQWDSWDADKKQAFYDDVLHYAWNSMTMEDRYNWYSQTQYHGYTCGVEGHYCCDALDHQDLLDAMAKGCDYCGKSDCVAFLHRNNNGFTRYEPTACPEYDVHKDPTIYCQDCGQIIGSDGCTKYINSCYCYDCGEWVEGGECHYCPND